MTNHARILKRALAEALQEKRAFQPPPDQQAAGPGGQPVDPGMGGGAPMDPMMGGGPPMDPGMGGAPPMDPGMGGGPPMDPGMGGDPMMGAPMDLPPEELLGELDDEPGEGEASISGADVEALKSVQENTMDIVRQTLEMVGKAKPVEGKPEGGDGAGTEPPPAPAPDAQPGPVTGQPGFDPAAFGKLGEAVRRKLAQVEDTVEDDSPGLLQRGWDGVRGATSAAWDRTQDFMGRNPWAGTAGGAGVGALAGLLASRGLRRGRDDQGRRRRLDLGDILAAGTLGVGGAMLGRHLTPDAQAAPADPNQAGN